MPYLLDTNVCVAYLRGRNPSVRQRLMATPSRSICLCSVVKAELIYGALRSSDPVGNRERVETFSQPYRSLSFDDVAAENFAAIRRHLEALGITIGPYDLQIAAIALTHGYTLVTHNTQEFSRISKLLLDDWELT